MYRTEKFFLNYLKEKNFQFPIAKKTKQKKPHLTIKINPLYLLCVSVYATFDILRWISHCLTWGIFHVFEMGNTLIH